MNEQCPECNCDLEPVIMEDQAYMRCVGCGWMRLMSAREFMDLPMTTRNRILAQQANDYEIIKYYGGLDIDGEKGGDQ